MRNNYHLFQRCLDKLRNTLSSIYDVDHYKELLDTDQVCVTEGPYEVRWTVIYNVSNNPDLFKPAPNMIYFIKTQGKETKLIYTEECDYIYGRWYDVMDKNFDCNDWAGYIRYVTKMLFISDKEYLEIMYGTQSTQMVESDPLYYLDETVYTRMSTRSKTEYRYAKTLLG